MAPRPLTSRPVDLAYAVYFIMHIPATLLIDCQALYPTGLLPRALSQIPEWYVRFSGDPLISGAMGYTGTSTEFAWFYSFLCLELLFQLPLFVLGARGLWKDSRSIYVPILVYGASTATTTLACVALILATSTTSATTLVSGIVSVTTEQRVMLLASYLPFFFVPLVMTVDMALRVQKLATLGANAKSR